MKRLFAIALALACSTSAFATEVSIPGGRVTSFNDPPTAQDLARASTTAANLLVYNSICAPLSVESLTFAAQLMSIAGRVRVEEFMKMAMGFTARNGVDGFCFMVRDNLPREVFVP